MEQEQKKKLEKLKDFLQKTEISSLLPFSDLLEEIRDSLKVIAEKDAPETPKMPEFPTEMGVEIKGAEVVTIQGIKGDKGDKGDVGEKGDNGVDGYTPKKNKDYFDGRNPLTASKSAPTNPQIGDLWYKI